MTCNSFAAFVLNLNRSVLHKMIIILRIILLIINPVFTLFISTQEGVNRPKTKHNASIRFASFK